MNSSSAASGSRTEPPMRTRWGCRAMNAYAWLREIAQRSATWMALSSRDPPGEVPFTATSRRDRCSIAAVVVLGRPCWPRAERDHASDSRVGVRDDRAARAATRRAARERVDEVVHAHASHDPGAA